MVENLEEKIRLINLLLEKTQKGRVQDWNERIAAIVSDSGLKISEFAWTRPPYNIAMDVVRAASMKISLSQLEASIEKYEEGKMIFQYS